jgi:hypothetical protein
MTLDRVFVLSTGRCGSTTFVRACEHMTNWSAAHESRLGEVGDARLAYPVRHIEADNRLTWLLGRVHEAFDDERTLYVHLRRDDEATARSFLRRWRKGIIGAYAKRVLSGSTRKYEAYDICLDYVHTVNANIALFLEGRPNGMQFSLETARQDFPVFWERIDAEGDLDSALAEWGVHHNAS